MAKNSKIGWTQHTMNFWQGCNRVSDQQKCAKLLNERLDERLGDDEARWAIYERLAKRNSRGCPAGFARGSLCELEMIERCFKGKEPISVHVLTDEWPANRLDASEVVTAGADCGQSLEGDQRLIEKSDYKSPKHSRDVRSVRGWINFQFLVMRGCRKPWLKKNRKDPNLPVLHPEEFVRRYFFSGMEWDNTLVDAIYFNLKTRKVFFRFGSLSERCSDDSEQEDDFM
jgi:hypothetical protein